MKLLDKIASLRYLLGRSTELWAFIRFSVGFMDKLGVGCMLVGLFQQRREGLLMGAGFFILGAILNILDARRK